MPNLIFKTKDAHAVMNTLVHEITGQNDISVVDTSSFISAGSKVLEAGYDSIFESLAVLIGKTIIASRKYEGKFKLIAEDSNAYDYRVRKISYYARDNIAVGFENTDIYTNLAAGLDDSDGVGSQYEQFPALCTERYFYSDFAWSKATTEYIEQIKKAFQNETDFINFVNGMMIEVQNDIESTLEAKNRAVVLDRIAGVYLQARTGAIGAECLVNLTKTFNEKFGTNYTTNEILSEHTVEFLQHYIAMFRIISDKMTNRSTLYHDTMEKEISNDTYHVLRHTPKDLQKFIYYSPLFTELNLNLANVFHDDMLKLENGEGIQYWQSITDPSAIDIKPALPDGATSSEVRIPLVVGLLFDRDALMVSNRFNGAYVTPLNARKLYQTLYWHYRYSVANDYSENSVLFIMEDEYTDTFEGDGTEVTFTLTNTAKMITGVTVNGVAVDSDDYTFSATNGTITFDTAPADDAAIVVNYV